MKYFSQFLRLLLLTLIFSCDFSSNKTVSFQELRITEANIAPFEEFVNEIEFIPFLIPEESPLKLNTFDPHLAIDDKIYFSTGDFRDASVHVFGLNGRYEQTFKKQGEGPEEYPYINGIDIIDDKIAIWNNRGTFKLYNKQNFNYEKTKTLAGVNINYIPDYQYLGDDKWILVDDYNEILDENGYYTVFHVLDEKHEEMKALPVKARMITSNIIEGQITPLSDKSYILNFGASDTLYHFKSDSLRPWIKLNLADNNAPESEKLDQENFFENIVLNQTYSFNIGTALAANDIVRIGVFGIKKSVEMDEDNPETFPIQHIYIHYPSMKFSVSKAFGAFGGKGYSKEGFYYEILYAENIISYIESNYFGKHTAQLKAAMEQLIDEEDPILLKYNVKIK